MKSHIKFLTLLIFPFFLSSCVETVIIGSTATGVTLTREKSLSNTRKDIFISSKIGLSLLKNGLKTPGDSIDITVNEGRVLLTGTAEDLEEAKFASDLAWQVSDVKEVIDEVQINDGKKGYFASLVSSFEDYLTTGVIEAKLLATSGINSFNYQVTTVNKNTYVLGVAQNNQELQKALKLIAKTGGVTKVINYAILANDPRRGKTVNSSSRKDVDEKNDEETTISE